jgi:hypothetical protein
MLMRRTSFRAVTAALASALVVLSVGLVGRSAAKDPPVQPAADASSGAATALAPSFEAFRRARTANDEVPVNLRGNNPDLRDLGVDDTRLVYDRRGTRVWLVPWATDRVCVFSKFQDSASMACTTVSSAAEPTPMVDFGNGGLVALVPDQIGEMTLERSDGSTSPTDAGTNVRVVDDASKPRALTYRSSTGVQTFEFLPPPTSEAAG